MVVFGILGIQKRKERNPKYKRVVRNVFGGQLLLEFTKTLKAATQKGYCHYHTVQSSACSFGSNNQHKCMILYIIISVTLMPWTHLFAECCMVLLGF